MPRYFRVEPYADEELSSILTRTLRRVGLSPSDFVGWYLERPKCPLATIGNLVPGVAELIGRTPRHVLQAHTLVPYGIAGLPVPERRRLTMDFICGRQPALSRLIGRLGRRWCEICLRLDLDRLGESYWHRCHLLPGVATCPLHGTRLLQMTEPLPNQRIDLTVRYWLGGSLPHELVGLPVALPVATSLLHDVTHCSVRALHGRRALPMSVSTPSTSRQVLGPALLHYAGCRASAIGHLPPTTARILSLVAERRLARFGTSVQLELTI